MQAVVDCLGVEPARDPSEDTNWKEAHQKLLELAAERASLDFEEGRWLLSALRSGAHKRLGYGSFAQYVERLFGYGARFTQEKLRVAEALEELPATAEALRTGNVSFSTARDLTRVAIPSTEQAWLQVARGKTVREVERLVSGQRPGSLPGDVPDARLKLHVLRFEVSGHVLATFREAIAKTRRDAGEPLTDDAALLALARLALGGPREEGRASYQVALTVCEHCRKGWQEGRGELIEVSSEVVEMAECDAQHIGMVADAHAAHVDATSSVRTLGDPHVGFGAHVDGGARADSGAHVDVTARPRAKQSVPPSVRRQVLRRDGGRCRVPGCRHATFVDVHHRKPRSEQGGHHPDNLITLCSAHHHALHVGALVIDGSASIPCFRHADGTLYGKAPSPAAVGTFTKASQGLRNMGFRETEVQRVLATIDAGPDPDFASLIRKALSALVKPKV